MRIDFFLDLKLKIDLGGISSKNSLIKKRLKALHIKFQSQLLKIVVKYKNLRLTIRQSIIQFIRIDRKIPLIISSEIWTSIKCEFTKFYHLIEKLLDLNRSLELSINQMILLSNIKHE